MSLPTHWQAVKHLFRYLKGTLDYKLTYSPTSCSAPHQSELFLTYSDADHKGDSDTKYSTGAYAVKMGTGAISWSSKLQTVVAKSTTEAEYHAACAASSELMFLRNSSQNLATPSTLLPLSTLTTCLPSMWPRTQNTMAE